MSLSAFCPLTEALFFFCPAGVGGGGGGGLLVLET